MPFRQWLPNVLLALVGNLILFATVAVRLRKHRNSKFPRGT
jgi:hypothetical protein